MSRLAACLALALLAGTAPGAAQSQPRGEMGREGAGGSGNRPGSYANPSAAIAAELAFARLAREKGQWTAFAETAAPDAVMFAPAMVLAQPWLKKRANPPPPPLTWRPYQVWASCDGSLMVTNGGWQRGDKHGWFTTVWQRQEKGGYKWVLDHGDDSAAPVAEPDMIAARVAECPMRRAGARPPNAAGGPPQGKRGKPPKREKAPPVPFDPAQHEGKSDDGSLTWRVTATPDGAHRFIAQLMLDGRMQAIRDETVAAARP